MFYYIFTIYRFEIFHKTWPELPAQHALQLGQRTLAD
jgi:hypothetical protein